MLKVKTYNLILITAVVWTAVSFLLIKRAVLWYPEFTALQATISGLAGLILSFVKFHFIFIKVTRENIDRIMTRDSERISILKMHKVKLYLLILLMIGTGTILRNIEIIPKYTLFPIYSGVGLAMIYASFMYYSYFIKHIKSFLKSE